VEVWSVAGILEWITKLDTRYLGCKYGFPYARQTRALGLWCEKQKTEREKIPMQRDAMAMFEGRTAVFAALY
jgi:hypothetical protein